jgi:soluble lytic murein transglycosylase-like protein
VPEPVLAAVAACESSFLPNSVSSAGAKGLMQIMPMNFKWLRIRDPFDPEQSVMGAARFLRHLYLKTGNWRGALASYHCGLGCWRSRRVPRVTRKYVSCTLRQYRFFKEYGPWRS